MEITGNKAKINKDGKSITQDVTYSDAYEEVKVRLQRKGNQAVITAIEKKGK